MFKYWDLAIMSLCMQFLMSFLWVPLAAYAHSLGWHTEFLSKAFALCIGFRFVPNAIVMRLGAPTEIFMVICVGIGYTVAMIWPTARWALFTLSVGSGMFFPRACVALHMKTVTGGNVDELSLAAKRCASARALASVLNYTLIPCAYMKCGWSGVCTLALCFASVYFVLSLKFNIYSGKSAARAIDPATKILGENAENKRDDRAAKWSIIWIDWAMAAVFVSTELQTNTFATVMPTVLMDQFHLSPSWAGCCLAGCYLCAMIYLTLLSSLPRSFNPPRPVNLVRAYFAIASAGFLMAAACRLFPKAGLVMIIVGAMLYTTMIQAAQTIMQECMTAVMTLGDATTVMGFSEVCGCFVGIIGGYFGQVSLGVGYWAPFSLMAVGAVISWTLLVVSLAVRAQERKKRGIYFNEWQEQESMYRTLLALCGLDELCQGRPRRTESCTSYITEELRCRNDDGCQFISDAAAGSPFSAGSP